ncbi:MAG: serine protease [Oscillospiraceae bacterium]|nr:serine protease [Oscillospiraceae bacterium]
MEDKRTPMEAEVQELPEERKQSRFRVFYGTSAKPRTRRSYTWAWICLSVGLIAISTFGIVATILRIRLEKGEDGWRINYYESETTEATEDPVQDLTVTPKDNYKTVPIGQAGTVQFQITAEGDALAPSDLYSLISPAVVCVEVETYYGRSSCTGVVISQDGYILSATEGLSSAISVTVTFSDGTQYAASRVGEERVSGLCLLKVEAKGLPTVTFAKNSALSVGQGIYCICNPFGSLLPNVFYSGMLAASGDVDVNGKVYTVLQTSTQLSRVGYGCPILDSRGLVVGLTTPIGKQFLSTEDPCFAVCAEDLTEIIESFERDTQSIDRWLGLEVETIPEDYMYLFGFPGNIWIVDVAAGSAPYGVLCNYDVITSVDDIEVNTPEEYEQAVSSRKVGSKVTLTIYRAGVFYKINLPVLAR